MKNIYLNCFGIFAVFNCLSSESYFLEAQNKIVNASQVVQIVFDDYLNGNDSLESAENFRLSKDQFKTWLQKIYTPDRISESAKIAKCRSNDSSNHEELLNCLSSKKCLNVEQFLSLTEENGSISLSQVQELCPLILNQAQGGACRLDINSETPSSIRSLKPSTTEIWGFGMLFVTLISLCSICGIAVFPIMGKTFYKKVLSYLVGLAVGSLLSSAIFHLIPQTFGLLSSGTHDYLWKAIIITGGVYLFFFTERFMRIIMLHRQRKAKDDGSKKISKNKNYIYSELALEKNNVENTSAIKALNNSNPVDLKENEVNPHVNHASEPHTLCHHDHGAFLQESEGNAIATVAYMIIFGDGLHNFIDGLSIGAAFSENIMAGISISVAIICEEFPHELGDFAVLLNAGMSSKQAILYNFLSACTCYCGLIVGILLGELEEASTYIFAIAAGMFLYISLVDMLPEMNLAAEEAASKSLKLGLKVLFIQSIGMATGVIAIFVLALYSEHINFET